MAARKDEDGSLGSAEARSISVDSSNQGSPAKTMSVDSPARSISEESTEVSLVDSVASMSTSDVDAEILEMLKNKEALFQKRIDRWAFAVGVVNVLVLASLFFSQQKAILFYYYTVKFLFLIPCRFIIYRPQKWGYFLLDYCYFINLLLLIYIWFFPHVRELFAIAFLGASGPLLTAVGLFRNSLVFHSMDKITSCFIHVSPAMLVALIRYFPHDLGVVYWGQPINYRAITEGKTSMTLQPGDFTAPWHNWNIVQGEPFRFAQYETLSITDGLFFALGFYCLHQLFYLILIKIVFPLPSDPEYLTTYRCLVVAAKRGPAKAAVMNFPLLGKNINYGQPLAFFLCNVLFTGLASLPSVWLYNIACATAGWVPGDATYYMVYGGFWGMMAIRSGANFYFEVFSKTYLVSLQKRAVQRAEKKAAMAVGEKKRKEL